MSASQVSIINGLSLDFHESARKIERDPQKAGMHTSPIINEQQCNCDCACVLAPSQCEADRFLSE